MLENKPPLNRSRGLNPQDRAWKELLCRLILNGELEIPVDGGNNSNNVRLVVDIVAHRMYYVAKTVQVYYDNPNHGNYRDPFLETLLILLSWRTRIRDANMVLNRIISEFENPLEFFETSAKDKISSITKCVGFSGKRPDMIVEVARHFMERFPDGVLEQLFQMNDEDVIDFLTSIPGIGRKSALCVLMYSLERDRMPIDAHIRRVFRRTGILRELYHEDRERDHRRFQAEVEPLVPPSVRRVLHAGLIPIGQEFCIAAKPKCAGCPIRNLCNHYRTSKSTLAQGRSFTHIDLYCGAGGFGSAFSKENYRTLMAVDLSEDAAQTFQLNHPDVPDGNVVLADLGRESAESIIDRVQKWKKDISPGNVDVITAGLPCQGFSKAGYRSRPNLDYDPEVDPRNSLYESVVEWTKRLRPRYVVIENVPDMRSAGGLGGGILAAVCRALEDHNYVVDHGSVNAFDFGVPQIRHRLILIASHPSVPPVKVVDLYRWSKKGRELAPAIGDLPQVEVADGEWFAKIRDRVVTGHVARFNNPDDLEIFRALRPGEPYPGFVKRRKDIIEKRRANGSRAVYSTKSFSDKFRKLKPNEPSRAIVAHLQRDGNGYIHYEQARSLTPREAMRIQGFDDDFVACGSRGAQFIQIGNAIPPPLARAIAGVLKQNLKVVMDNESGKH
jgi:DNA (cytosine-5)-methyltransferase 1